MDAFNTTTKNYIFSTTTPQDFNLLILTRSKTANIYINQSSSPSVLPVNQSYNLNNLSDVYYLQLTSGDFLDIMGSYEPSITSAPVLASTSITLPSDFINTNYLIAVLLIFGFIIFIGSVIFRYIRFF